MTGSGHPSPLKPFKRLKDPAYEKNEEKIRDIENLNRRLGEILEGLGTDEVIEMFRKITVPISKIQSLPEVLENPLLKGRC